MYVVPHNVSPLVFRTFLFQEYLPISRFRIVYDEAGIEIGRWDRVSRVHDALKIKGVRLKRKKPYCGQHAGPCRLTGIKHHPRFYLEGLDWVAFNDMLNDLCDAHRIEADIWTDGREQSGRLYLRHGRRRRDRYNQLNDTPFWDAYHDPNDFTDIHFGKSEPDIRSDYVEGTPGLPEWLRVKEDLYPQLFEAHHHDEEHEEEVVQA